MHGRDGSARGCGVSGRRWYELEGDALGTEVISIAAALETEANPRRTRYLRDLSHYENQGLTELAAWAYDRGALAGFDELTYNLGRSLVDTIVSQVCGQQRPRPMFMTAGADWRTRRRAKRLDKFVDAGLHQRQGRYRSSWELLADVFTDSLVWGMGVAYVYADGGRVAAERVYPWELLIDPVEAQNGEPQSLFRVTHWDRARLIETFVTEDLEAPERERITAAIESAKAQRIDAYSSGARVAEQVRMIEAWHLQNGKRVGLHAYAVPGALLHSEEYQRDEYPLVIMRGSQERVGGWYGRGVIDEVRKLLVEINHTIEHLSEQVRINASQRCFYEAGSIDQKDLESNEVGANIPVKAGTGMAPIVSQPPPYHPGELEWLQYLVSSGYSLPGVSEQGATARREPGITSAVGQRFIAALGTVRQAVRGRGYEQAFVDYGRHWVRAAADAAADGGTLSLAWPGKRFLDTIDWSEVNLDEDQYVIQVAPVSSLPTDPAGRMQLVHEVFAEGVISPETYRRLLGWPDLEAEQRRDSSQYEYVQDLIERYLDADEETFDPVRDYETAEGYMLDKPGAMIQVVSAYFEARMDRTPAFNLELLRRYIDSLDLLMQRETQMAEQRAQGAAAPPGLPAPAVPEAPMPEASAQPMAMAG